MPRWNVRFDLKIDLTETEAVRLIERAHALAGVISEVPIPPYLQMKVNAVNILRAVKGTTGIEGGTATTQEVQAIMNSPEKRMLPLSREKEEQEIRNAQAVMYYIASILREQPGRPLTEALVCEFHKQMTQGIRYENNVPGEYRSHSVNAGTYLPPETGEEVRTLMQQFVEWLNTPPVANWDSIVRALAAHFYLVSIHPFGDGNGRTSRAVESYLLYAGKVNALGFYSLANYYYQKRAEYVEQLDYARFSSGGDLTPFIKFGLRGLVSELEGVHQDVLKEIKVISFRDFARETFLTHGLLGTKAGARGFYLLMGIGQNPVPMTEVYKNPIYKGVTKRTVQRDIQFLTKNDLVIVQNGMLAPNFEVMTQFTPIKELERGIPPVVGHARNTKSRL